VAPAIVTPEKTILIVDDSPLSLEYARRGLSTLGFRVVTRGNAIGTAAAVLREKPAVVLLDVTMPTLNGVEVCQSIRDSSAVHDTVVLLYSDRPEMELVRLTRECRANGYVVKGAGMGSLIAAVKAWVGDHELPPPITPRKEI